jgi:type VII secretion-associated protein (TIGR03931 family)
MTVTAALCVTTDGVVAQVRRDGVLVDTLTGSRVSDVVGRISAARIDAGFPSHWAATRRDRLADELGIGGARVEMTPIAIAAASFVGTSGAGAHGPRVVVVELERLSSTVTYVSPDGAGMRVVACEREPALGAEDVLDAGRTGTDTAAIATLCDLVERVTDGRAVDEILVLADHDQPALEPLLAGLAKASPRAGRSRVLRPAEMCPLPAVERTEHSPRTALSRAIGLLGRGPMPAVAFGAALIIGAGGLWWWQTGMQHGAAAPSAETATGAPIAQPAGDVTHENGRVRFLALGAWSARPVDPQRPGRRELVPVDGAAARIIVIQNEIDPGLGYDEVASALADKIAARGSDGPFADLQRDVVFAGRPGVSYRETPNPGSEVRWHVVVEQELQVSVGCQYPAGEWGVVEHACEKVVRSLTVAPSG